MFVSFVWKPSQWKDIFLCWVVVKCDRHSTGDSCHLTSTLFLFYYSV